MWGWFRQFNNSVKLLIGDWNFDSNDARIKSNLGYAEERWVNIDEGLKMKWMKEGFMD